MKKDDILREWHDRMREACNECFELAAQTVESNWKITRKELAALIRAMKTKL